MKPTQPRFYLFFVCVCFVLYGGGCFFPSSKPEVVVYASLDREFSEPILKDFEKQTGIRVRTKFDSESQKTVGLTAQILTESQSRVRCDLFWNNEILNTLRLEEAGLLRSVSPDQKDLFPTQFRSVDDRWFGFATRARVLIVNTEIVSPENMPDSIYGLLDPKWKGKTAIAKPLYGTTATHAVCLFEKLGETTAKELFSGLKKNDVRILSGNKQVAEDVAAGRFAFGLTDTDDAIIELEKGFSVQIVFPDAKANQMGTLLIPNTLAVFQNSPNQKAANKLMDFLLTHTVEQRLAAGKSAQIPVRSLGTSPALDSTGEILHRLGSLSELKMMEVDFHRAVKQWSLVSDYLKNEFLVPAK